MGGRALRRLMVFGDNWSRNGGRGRNGSEPRNRVSGDRFCGAVLLRSSVTPAKFPDECYGFRLCVTRQMSTTRTCMRFENFSKIRSRDMPNAPDSTRNFDAPDSSRFWLGYKTQKSIFDLNRIISERISHRMGCPLSGL